MRDDSFTSASSNLKIRPTTFDVAQPARAHDFVGASALACGVFCAGTTFVTVHRWRAVGEYRAGLPPGATEGTMGFSLQLIPWLLTFFSIAVGGLTAALLAFSFLRRQARRQSQFALLQIGTVLALLPLLYYVALFATALF